MKVILFHVLLLSALVGQMIFAVPVVSKENIIPPPKIERKEENRSKGIAPSQGAIFISLTSFNPLFSQTDHDPCVGASLRNLCTAANEGDNVMAISRDLLWRNGGPFKWHDKVELISDTPACSGVFSVEDTMHARFSKRGDIFRMNAKENHGLCKGVEMRKH